MGEIAATYLISSIRIYVQINVHYRARVLRQENDEIRCKVITF